MREARLKFDRRPVDRRAQRTLLKTEDNMKGIVVVLAGTGQAHDLSIQPGTSARDVLNQLGLQGYVLSKDRGEHPFGESENIYTEVDDGEKLFAAAKTDVGRCKFANPTQDHLCLYSLVSSY